MKKRYLFAILAFLLALTAPVSAFADAGLLVNGGFDTTDGWLDQNGNEIAVQQETADIQTTVTDYRSIDFESFAEAETLTALSGGWNLQGQGDYFGIETVDGSKALRMSKDAASGHRYLSYYGASVTEGVMYRITFRAKATEAATLQTYFASPVTGSDRLTTLTTQWQTVSYEFVSPATQSTPSLYFQWLENTGTGKVYIDDLLIQTVETFENTTVDTVQKYFNDFSDASVSDWNITKTTCAVVEKDGEQALSFTPNGNSYITYYGVPFEEGKTYTVSCKVLTDEVISFRLYNEAAGTPVYQIGNTVAGQWTTYSITVTASSNVAQPSTYFGNMTGSGTVYIDDVLVTCEEEVTATTYTEGIGDCLGAEDSSVLAMQSYEKVYQAAALTQGAEYTYSFRVKGVNTDAGLSFGVQIGQTRISCAVTDSWTTVSGAFTAAADSVEFGFYRSGSGSVLLDDVSVVPLNCEHSNTRSVPARAATCTEDGCTEGIQCADCGLTLTECQQIPALGHSFDGATCSRCGCDKKDVVLRFAVLSDVHLNTGTQVTATNRKNRFAGMFTSAYDYAASQEYTGLDAVVVAGDLVDYGTQEEFELFDQLVNENLQDGTTLLTLAGNHDFWGDQDATGYKEYITAEENKDMDVVTTIGGYTFITISQRDNDVYTQDQKQWLADALAQTAGSDKPVFTFQHFGITNTVYGTLDDSITERTDTAVTGNLFHEEYARYNQVINFSGHTHTPINTPTIISQVDGYTQVATGTLYDMHMQADASYGKQPPNSNNIAQYYIVEVCADNTVTLLPYNILTGDFFGTPATEDGDAQLIYTVDVNDPENWLYTAEKQEQTAPFFGENTEVSFSEVTYKGAKVTFTQARDEHSGVYLYEVVCTPESGEVKTYTLFSEYYFEPMPETLTYGITGLQENTAYTVSVTPIDFYGNRGEAAQGVLQTASADDPQMQLTLSYYDSNSAEDKDLDLQTSNKTLLTGSYYSLEVIADGVSGKVAVSNYDSGIMTVWTSFITAINKALTVNESLLIPAGSCLEQVTSAGWKTIDGGDRETVRNDLYVEVNAAGTDYVDKTAYYSILAEAEETVAAITQVSLADQALLEQLLEQTAAVADNTAYLTDRVDALNLQITALLEEIENLPVEHEHDYVDGVCSICGATNPVVSYNIVLGDNIGMNFVLDTGMDVVIYVDGVAVDAEGVLQTDGNYKYAIELAAAQMTSQIVIEVEGEAAPNTYSVRKYADTLLADKIISETTKELLRQMLNYGAAAQAQFGVNTDDLANAGIDVTVADPEGESALASDGAIEGVSFYGASLVYRTETAVRFYFTGSVEGLTFTAGEVEYAPVSKDGMYCVEVDGINPQNLADVITLTVSNGTDSIAVSYSPLSYIVRMYGKDSVADSTKTLVKALYNYYVAAVAYVDATA